MSNAQQVQYTIIVEGADGGFYNFDDATKISFGYSLNRGTIATIEIPMIADCVNPYTKAVRRAKLYIYRKSEEETEKKIYWYGILKAAKAKGTFIDSSLVLEFEDIPSILKYRYTTVDYAVSTPTDTTEIITDLLDYTQALPGGDLGITIGSTTISKDRTADEELKDRSIYSIMESYANVVDGIDWLISPSLQNHTIGEFNTYFRGTGEKYHKGSVITTPLVFHVGDNLEVTKLNNIESYEINESGDNYANSVRVKGAAVEEIQLYSEASNATEVTAYGLYEKLEQQNDISVQDTLDDKAAELLSSTAVVPYDLTLTLTPYTAPLLGSYDVGDIFTVDFNIYDKIVFEKQYRLYDVDIDIDSKGIENVKLSINII